jgi:hypothetical protein
MYNLLIAYGIVPEGTVPMALAAPLRIEVK